jgi:hypothetical protein
MSRRGDEGGESPPTMGPALTDEELGEVSQFFAGIARRAGKNIGVMVLAVGLEGDEHLSPSMLSNMDRETSIRALVGALDHVDKESDLTIDTGKESRS